MTLKIYEEPTYDELIAEARRRRRNEQRFQVFLNVSLLVIGILFGFAVALWTR